MTTIVLTNHAKFRFNERGIDVHQAKKVVKTGSVAKNYPDGTMVIRGKTDNGETLEIVCKRDKNTIFVKTAYYAN